MKLTIYYDGQIWVGVSKNGKLKRKSEKYINATRKKNVKILSMH